MKAVYRYYGATFSKEHDRPRSKSPDNPLADFDWWMDSPLAGGAYCLGQSPDMIRTLVDQIMRQPPNEYGNDERFVLLKKLGEQIYIAIKYHALDEVWDGYTEGYIAKLEDETEAK